MKIRAAIGTKILGLFLVNLIVLGFALWFLVGEDFQLHPLPAFGEPAFLKLSQQVLAKVDVTPSGDWDEILTDAVPDHGVTLYLYNVDGELLAGPSKPLPPEVHQRLLQGRGRPLRDVPRSSTAPPGARPEPPPGPRSPLDFVDPLGLPPPPPPQVPGLGPEGGPPDTDPVVEPIVEGRMETILAPKAPRYWAMVRHQMPERRFAGATNRVALLAQSESFTGHGLFFDLTPYGVGVAGLLLVSVVMWLPFVHSATRSLRKMQQTASRLALGDFTARADDRRGDELGALGRSVNHMADQIGTLVHGQKRILGDIAHELSSPIARMQVMVGILESRIDDAQAGGYIHELEQELEHMGRLVRELLSLAKASLNRGVELRPIGLRNQIEQVMNRENAGGASVTLDIPHDLVVVSEPELLSRALANVLRNAIRYAGAAGPIRIEAALSPDQEDFVDIRVLDSGPGVPEEALPKLFDAFYRPDTARSRETGGTGLGLAIVKSCVECVGGRVLARNRPEGGLEVMMTQLAG